MRWYLRDKAKDAALVAFHSEKSSEWRFSFIKMQYSLEKKADELTPAKRSSFVVGESGKSHTAQRQLINLLKNYHAPYLSDIEDAFSIEAVSDEFYEKYKALLFNLADEIERVVNQDKTVKVEFESKNISILNFSKKLLVQIVFLYFLQKKGWLGLDEKDKYGEGDKNFLRSLFNKTKSDENFFNNYLEFLFYDALSKKWVTDYYERFKIRIPFLNGGLFDPIEFYDWQKTDIVIMNKIFSDRKSDEEGSGILDVFDLYNFTVKEDEPLETEVAITGMTHVLIDRTFEGLLSPSVSIDNYGGARMAIRHLITQGISKIAYIAICYEHISTISNRIKGFESAIKDAGLTVPEHFKISAPFEEIEQTVKESLQRFYQLGRCPRQSFTMNNNLTSTCLHYLRKLSLQVPRDIALIGFDDVLYFSFTQPFVSAIEQWVKRISEKAFELLMKQINKEEIPAKEREVILPVDILIRESSIKTI